MSQKTPEMATTSKTPANMPKKHLAFVEDYLLHFNPSKAYTNVYGVTKGNTAHTKSSLLMKDVKVQQYLNQRLAQRKAQLNVDASYVVRKLLDIVETDYVDAVQYLTEDQLNKIPKNVRILIQSIEKVKTTNRTENRDSTFETETEKFKVTFMSKDAALTSLGKHTGTYLKDNVNANINLDQMTFTDAMKQLDI